MACLSTNRCAWCGQERKRWTHCCKTCWENWEVDSNKPRTGQCSCPHAKLPHTDKALHGYATEPLTLSLLVLKSTPASAKQHTCRKHQQTTPVS